LVQFRRVVVTGIGLVTPVGPTTAETWRALLEGRSGVGRITQFDVEGWPVQIAAEVKGFDPEAYLSKKELRRMDRFVQFAMAAAEQAVRDSGLTIDDSNRNEVGVYIGSGIGGLPIIERQFHKMVNSKQVWKEFSPFFIPSLIVNMASGQVSIRLGARGPNSATCTACSTGCHAIGDSFKIIQRGDALAMLCGGTEAVITPLAIGGFAAARAISTRNDEPERASRPFDAERDGFVVGEGSGLLMLEELEYALNRGARIYAEVVGYGMSGDAFHITAPSEDGDGPCRVMQRAIRDAGIEPSQIDYINAHGTSTPPGDRVEVLAIKKAFGEHAYKVAISSTKSMVGHLLGAAGGVETAVMAKSLAEQIVHPTINYEVPDPECDLDFVPNKAREMKIEYALSNSFGFGGTNAAVLMKRFAG
jgi:3-oxoacyl-[acyl-carrier-protein] synthase II